MPVLVIGKKLFTCRWLETLDGTAGSDIIMAGAEQLPASAVLKCKGRELLNHSASPPKAAFHPGSNPSRVLRDAQIKHRGRAHTQLVPPLAGPGASCCL